MWCRDKIDERFLEEGLSAPLTPSPQWTPAVSTPVNLQRPRTTLEMSTIKGSNSKHTAASWWDADSEQSRVCPLWEWEGGVYFKANSGTQLLRCVCVFWGVCVCGRWTVSPCTGRALRSISASKFHLKETKTRGSTEENSGSQGLADRLKTWIKINKILKQENQKSEFRVGIFFFFQNQSGEE